MESLQETTILKFSPDTLMAVRQDVNLHRPGEMKEAVKILDEWIKKQGHFRKKDFPVHYLEFIIVSSKGSVEGAKIVIDKLLTARTLMPKYLEPLENTREVYETILKGKLHTHFGPNLTPENYRLVLEKYVGKIIDNNVMDNILKYSFLTAEYLRAKDYNSGVVMIYDFTELDLGDLVAKVNYIDLKNCIVTLINAYKFRLKRCHFITSSNLIHVLLTFLKKILGNKVFDRFQVHKSTSELFEYYPRNCIPKDFGGDGPSSQELHEKFVEAISSNEQDDHMKYMYEARTDESLRPLDQFSEKYAGTPGTFRVISLD